VPEIKSERGHLRPAKAFERSVERTGRAQLKLTFSLKRGICPLPSGKLWVNLVAGESNQINKSDEISAESIFETHNYREQRDN
jgi:hypothetical protein